MNVDFTNDIIKLKRREVAHKPFRQSNSENVCIFEQREDKMVKVVFENVESTAKYLDHLGYEWDQKEYDNYILKGIHKKYQILVYIMKTYQVP